MSISRSDLRVTTSSKGQVLCFPKLFAPEVSERFGGAPAYSVEVLIDKDDTETLKKLKSAQEKAMEFGQENIKEWNGRAPKPGAKDFTFSTIHDGDELNEIREEEGKTPRPEYVGRMVMSVRTGEKFPPKIVDRRLREIREEDGEIYSGVIARLSLSAFPYGSLAKGGISFGLNNVQKLRDGDRLGGGGGSVAGDFDELDDDEDDDLI